MSTKTYNRIVFSLSLGLSAFVLATGYAHANPEDGQVTAGSATIESVGKKLNIHQSSQKAVINWKSFNIAPDEHTQFYQPNSSSFTLNRVQDTSASRIQGMLSANGNIAIINPNGIYFDHSSQIDVGGLIATTANITDADFMNGHGNFSEQGNPDAHIINYGSITASDAGLVGLVAPRVENRGVIKANLGKVTLASGDTFVYDFAGDNLIGVAVSDQNAEKQHLAKNAGTIEANGGQVLITAGAAREVVNGLVTNTGVIEAKSIGTKNGKIVLSASGSNRTSKTGTSTVLNEGTLNVSGNNAGETGGTVHMLGDHVGAMANSEIIATGHDGGGEILVGGEFQGADDTQAAHRTYVDKEAFVNASAIQNGDGGRIIAWADDINRTYGTLHADGGAQGGDGGFIEISGKHDLDFQGLVSLNAPNGELGTLLLDPTDLVISNNVDMNVTAASAFTPNLDDGPSNLNVTTLQNAIASGNVTVQTSATGTQLGDITINDPISWSANRTVNITAHNKIYVNAPVTARGTLNLTAADIDINAAMSEHASGGSLYLIPRANNITVGIADAAGAFNVSNADLDFIQNGWNAFVIGATGATAAMNVNARTWNVPTTLRTGTGLLSVNGTQTMIGSNGFTLQTRNLTLGADLIGAGTLRITPGGNYTVGIAGGAGALNLTTAELDHIIDGWGNIGIGHTSSTQAVNVNAYTWKDNLTLYSRTGAININATPDMGSNNLTLQGRNFVFNADLVGTGTLTLQPDGNVTVGVAGGAGTLNLSTALLDRIIDGWSQINIGITSSTQAMNVNAYTWNDSVAFRTAAGVITIDGAQNVGANNLSIFTNGNPVINAPLIGSGDLRFEQIATGTTMGLAGETGTYNLSVAELNQIVDGWNLISFGLATNDGAFRIGAYNWNDSVKFQNDSGVITITGDQNVGANDLTIHSDANPAINAALIGTGTLTLETDAGGTTIGVAGGGGTYNLSVAELDQIADGWAEIIIGRTNGTGAMAVNAYNWNDSLRLQSNTGVITIAGAQNVGTNNMRIITSGNLALNSTLTGSGDLTIETSSNNTTIGLAGGSGTLNLTTAELDRITDGWNKIHIGKSTGTGAMAVNAYTWNDDLELQTNSGVITIAGAQDLGSNDLGIYTSGNLALNAALNGSGDLRIETTANNTSIGLAGGSGTLNINAAELDRITDGWNSIHIGKETGTGTLNVNAYDWRDALTLQTSTGNINIAGAQTFGANDFTIQTNALALNQNITGTGRLSIIPGASGTTVGLAGGAGTLNLTTAELNRIVDGWTNITIGRTDGTGAMAINTHAWNDDLILQSGTGNITIAGIQNLGANDLTLTTSALAVNAGVNGTGALVIAPDDLTTSIGLAGAAGTLNLSTAELNNFNTGWSNVTIGRTGATGVTRLGGTMTLNDSNIMFEGPVELTGNSILNSGNGDVDFNDTLNGGFDLDINSTGDITLAALAGGLSRLGHLSLNNIDDLDVAAGLNVSALDVTATGAADFNGTGLNSTGAVDITSAGITGTLLGTSGALDSGAGTINAQVSFGDLDIEGAGATLTAGYIGAPGVPTQAMANLITNGGVPFAVPSALFTFDAFEIGYVPPQSNTPAELFEAENAQDIINILKQPSYVLLKYQDEPTSDYLIPVVPDYSQNSIDMTGEIILIHPDLLSPDL